MIKKFIFNTWNRSSGLFDIVQKIFNIGFWGEFNNIFGIFSNESVLDFACGTGELLEHIKPKIYKGVDINTYHIQLARRKFKNKNAEFLVGDISNYKLDGKYDDAFLISAAHHLSDLKMNQVMKKISSLKIKKAYIIDAIPKEPFYKILAYLDGALAGGKYLRNDIELEHVASKYLKVIKAGCFVSKMSFYKYPYVVAKK